MKTREVARIYARLWRKRNLARARAAVRKSYEKHKAKRLAKQKIQYLAQCRWFNRLKNVPCFDCGYKYPRCVMEFDHTRGVKKYNITGMAGGYKRETIQKEIDKCDVVCANCHNIRTHRRRNKQKRLK